MTQHIPGDFRLWWRPVAAVPILRWDVDTRDDIPVLLDRVQRCGSVDMDELATPQSDDSWEAFCRRSPVLAGRWDWEQETKSFKWWDEKPRQGPTPTTRHAQSLQEKWEAEARARELAKQAEADRLWTLEEKRRAAEEKRQAKEARKLREAEEKLRLSDEERRTQGIERERQEQIRAQKRAAQREDERIAQLEIVRRLWPRPTPLHGVQCLKTRQTFHEPDAFAAHLWEHNIMIGNW